MLNFSDWEPAPLLGEPSVTGGDAFSNIGGNNNNHESDDAKMAGDRDGSMQRADLARRLHAKAQATKDYARNVDMIATYGVETSSGSGHTLPVPALTAKTLERIIKMVPSTQGLLESEQIQGALGTEVRAVQADYGHFAAKATLNYLIKDTVTAEAMGIDTTALNDNV